MGTNTYRNGIDLGTISGRHKVILEFPEFRLLDGEYFVNLGIWPDEWKSYTSKTPYDISEYQYILTVHSDRSDGGGLTRSNGIWTLNKLPENI